MPSKVRLVTDTTACLPPGFAEAHGVEVVPQIVRFGEEAFLEGVEISYADYIQRLKSSASQAGTAAAPPAEFIKAYRRQLAIGSTILSLHPSNEISGTVRSANIAKSEGFAVALQENNKAVSAETVFASEGSARDWMADAVANDRSLAGKLHVVPEFELAA